MAKKKNKKKDVEGNALTNIFTRKPKTVNLSKETLDKITPVLESMQSSLVDQTTSLRGLVDAANTTILNNEDADEKAARLAQLGQSSAKDEPVGSSGLGVMSDGGGADTVEAGGKKKGGLLGGLLGGGVGLGAAGAGIGLGAVLAGAGALLGGAGVLLEQLNDLDGKKIRENVGELLAISDDFDGVGDFFVTNGAFIATMTGLGAGLLAFSVGAGSAVVLNKFEGDGSWVDAIKDNVTSLLELPSLPGVTIGNVAGFTSAMAAIGAGLLAFGVGAAVNQFSDGTEWSKSILANVGNLLQILEINDVSEDGADTLAAVLEKIGGGLTSFAVGGGLSALTAGGDNWGADILSNVTSLLQILEIDGVNAQKSKVLADVLANIGIGLVAFSIGKATGAAASGLSSAVGLFTKGDNFADDIKEEVGTLLSILNLPGAQTPEGSAGFLEVMAGIGAGLVAFGAGKGFASIIQLFTSENFAQGIKDEVDILTSITDNVKDDGSNFVATMENIGEGLSIFTSDGFFSGLKSAFTFGDNSMISEITAITDEIDKLDEAADSLDKFSKALSTFSTIKISDSEVNFHKLAVNLSKSIPILEGLTVGNKIKFDGQADVDFGKGLINNPNIQLNEVSKAVDIFGDMNNLASTPDAIAKEQTVSTPDAIKRDRSVGVLRVSPTAQSIAPAETSSSATAIAHSILNQDAKSAKQQQQAANIAVSAPGPVVTTINRQNQQKNTSIFIQPPGNLASKGGGGF